jgi:hypothetical protein
MPPRALPLSAGRTLSRSIALSELPAGSVLVIVQSSRSPRQNSAWRRSRGEERSDRSGPIRATYRPIVEATCATDIEIKDAGIRESCRSTSPWPTEAVVTIRAGQPLRALPKLVNQSKTPRIPGQVSTIHWHGMPVPAAQDGNPMNPVTSGS